MNIKNIFQKRTDRIGTFTIFITIAFTIVSASAIITPEQKLLGKQSNSECKNQEPQMLGAPQQIIEPRVQLIGFSNMNLSEVDSSDAEVQQESEEAAIEENVQESEVADEGGQSIAEPASNASSADGAAVEDLPAAGAGGGTEGPAPSDDCYETVMQESCRAGYIDGGSAGIDQAGNSLKWCCPLEPPGDDCYETVMQESCREGYMDGGFSRMSPGTMNELKWCCPQDTNQDMNQ